MHASKLLVAAAVAGVAGVAVQANAAPVRTLHLVERGGGLAVVDNPPKAAHRYDFSAGDIVVVSRDLYAPGGARAGSLRLVCVATTATTQQCSGTESLAGGTLELAGVSGPAPSTTVAVIGGTGAYGGARGTSVSTDRHGGGDVADQIVTLVP